MQPVSLFQQQVIGKVSTHIVRAFKFCFHILMASGLSRYNTELCPEQ